MFSALLVPKEQCQTSRWSGGATTQLAIYPPEAQYAQRDFIWRLSSATVEEETSTFTDLPEYNRVLSIIQGSLTLSHNGAAPLSLAPLELDQFDGGCHTVSQGRVTDFNLMMRKGLCDGSVQSLRLAGGSSISLDFLCQSKEFPLFTLALYCAQGAVGVEAALPQPYQASLTAGDLLLLSLPSIDKRKQTPAALSSLPGLNQAKPSGLAELVKIALSSPESAAVFLCQIQHQG